jgi:outer membrane murein-binding lipoprotein Lpp
MTAREPMTAEERAALVSQLRDSATGEIADARAAVEIEALVAIRDRLARQLAAKDRVIDNLASELRELTAERNRLTERCDAYKGQVEAGAAEIARLKEAARNAEMYLRTGFIECQHCGNDVETETTDARHELRAALSETAPASETEADGPTHFGDPCVYCGTPHDDVTPGQCPGEHDPRALARERNEAVAALKPFAMFGAQWTDEGGWTSNIHREAISTWFGPSDLRRAAEIVSRHAKTGGEHD